MGKEIVSKTTLAKGVTACVVVAASLGIIQIGEYSINSSEGTTASSNKGDMSYTPGTYTASSAGISSDVTVTCTFDESSITAITVDVSGETAGIGADIGDEMIEQFMAAQSADVDGVTSATITSNALKAALEDCIAQATGSGSGSSDAEGGTETETESEAETAESEADEEASESTDTDIEASDASTGAASYIPGTYTASAAGIESDVTVTITVDESSILSITCDVSGETAGLGADIGDEIIEQILSAQSADVDGVSGATVTSNAVMTATADALAQASEGAGDSEETDVATDETEVESEAAETEKENETDTAEAESDEAAAASAEADENATSGGFTPGTYTASSAGISSDVTVTCTFDETGLTEITADVSGETAGIGADIGDEMIAKVLEAQSADVDGVSGATITSNAFLAAVADCMEQAGFTGAMAAEDETETEAETEVVTEAETETELESESESETETEGISSSGEYTSGTYTASSAGISSDVTVTCTFDETGLTEITADVSGETAGIGADIGDEMIAKVLEAQSADVDGVSGATITSNAFLTAVADCMEQAGFTGATTAEDETETESETETEELTEVESESESETVTEAASEIETEAQTEAETEIVTEAQSEVETEAVTETQTEAETELVTETQSEAETEVLTEAESDIETEADASETTARFAPGVYTASAEGISSTVTVTIIVDENSILSVGYDLSGETSGIGAEIGPEISGQILTAQSAEVNGISGATITSDAFKEALADCIAQAESAAADVTDTGDADSEEAESETDEAASDDVSGLVTTYNSGIYTASAQGISSEVVVTVAFDDDSIVSIGYDLSGETAGIGADIGPEISGQILTAQSADVDGVSGATITSNAIKEAIAACIEQAKN